MLAPRGAIAYFLRAPERMPAGQMNFIELSFVWFMAIVFTLYWGAEAVRLPALRGGTVAVVTVALRVGDTLRAAVGGKRGGGPADAAAASVGWADARSRAEAALPDVPRVLQNLLLVVASSIFYGWVHPWFLYLIYASALLDWSAGLLIERYPHRKKLLLIASLTGNLGMLGAFKYYDFFVWNVTQLLQAMGVHANLTTLHWLLPAGISFYTFQSIAYTVDVYRGQLKPRKNLLDYLVFVTLFPQLVAGPIQRAASLLPQVEKRRTFELDAVRSGLGLALWGAFKKVVIADTIAPYVDEVFMTRDPAFVMVLFALFAFGVQMLADFSGYTDLARGTARMLGFHLTPNFDRPYAAMSTPEFWRRWHISLSSWVGDYVYTPLLRTGRPGPGRTIMAMMVTFLVVGLWHGASWNYVILGLWNGLWMVTYTFVVPVIPRKYKADTWANLPLHFGAWLFHTLVVLQPTGLLFREVSLSRAWQHVSQPWFQATYEETIAAVIVLSCAVLGTIPLNVEPYVFERVLPRLKASVWYLPIQTTFWAVEILAIFVFYRDASQDFIYFQF